MKRKIVSIMLAGIVIMTSLVGCGTGQKGGSTNADGKVVLRLAHYADQFETETVNKQIKAFMEENPDIIVETEPFAGDFWQVLLTRMTSKNEPDVFYMEGYQFDRFQDAGKLLDISDALSEEDKADFSENLLDGFTVDGKIYGVPKDYNTLALYYNEDMLVAAGVEVPTTWEELSVAAEKLTKDGKYGLSLQNEIARFAPFVNSSGGSIMQDGKPVVNSPEFIKAYEYWISLFDAGSAVIPKDIGADWDGVAFARGDVAMTIEGYWMVQSLVETAPELKYGIAPVPYDKEPASLMFTVAYSASINTKHPEEAKRLINYLTSYDMQKVFVESERAMPSRISNSVEFNEKKPELKVFVDAVDYSEMYSFGLLSSVVVDETEKAFQKVLKNDFSIKKALDEAQAVIDEALNKQ